MNHQTFVGSGLRRIVIAVSFLVGSVPAVLAEQLISANQFDCVVYPNETVNLGTVAAGVLSQVGVGRGDIVKKGQVLATVESRVEAANVEAARTRLAFEEIKLKRNTKLAKEKIISIEQLESIEMEADLAAIALKKNQALLELRKIKSPFDGLVTEKLLSTGDYVAGDTVLRVAQMHPLKVEARVPASLYAGVRVGMRAKIQFKEAVGGEYEGIISVRDNVLDAANSNFRVRIDLPNPDLKLPAGVRCSVQFLN